MTVSPICANTLSLVQAVETAFTHHPDLQQATLSEQHAASQLALSSSAFLPTVQINGWADYETDHHQFAIQQQVKLTTVYGTQLQLSTEQRLAHASPGWETHVGAHLHILQPLLKRSARWYNEQGLSAAKWAQQKSEYQYHQTKANVLRQVIQAYRQLQWLSIDNERQQAAYQMIVRSHEKIEQQVARGHRAAIEAAESARQVQSAQLAYQQGVDALALTWQKFWQTLGVMAPQPALSVMCAPTSTPVLASVDHYVTLALTQDITLKILQGQYELATLALAKIKADAGWQAGLKLQTHWDQKDIGFRHNCYPRASHETRIGVYANWPVTQHAVNEHLRQAHIDLQRLALAQQTRTQQLTLEVRQVVQSIQHLSQQLNSAETGVQLAMQNVTMADKKLTAGRLSIIERAHYDAQLQAAKIMCTRTKIALLNAHTTLAYITGTLLPDWEARLNVD